MLTHEAASLRRVEPIMGTVVSIEVRPPLVPSEVLDDVVRAAPRRRGALQHLPTRQSEISRLGRGELREEDCSLDVRHVLAACDHLAEVTGGAFYARRRGADGSLVLDPSGYVKGWAIEEAAWRLDTRGCPRLLDQRRRRHRRARPCRGAAGRGASASGIPTRPIASRPCSRSPTGPWRRRARTSAARTSPTRGPGCAPSGLRSVTVVGPAARLHRRVCDRRLRHGPRWPALARRAAGLRGAGDHRRRADGLDRRDGALPGPRGLTRPVSRATPPAGRQVDHEARPALGPVGDRDPAAVAVDDPGRDGEAQPGPAARRARGALEPLEDVRQVLGPDARAVVLDDERGAARRPPGRRPRPGRRSGCGGWRCRPGS